MLTTTTFVASFEFAVWTVSSSYTRMPAVQSLHLSWKIPQDLARDYHIKGFPEFDRIYLLVTQVSSPLTFWPIYGTIAVMTIGFTCIVCGTVLAGKQTHFCSLACKNARHQSYFAQKQRGLERKLYLVESLGGKCSNCGYAANLAALAFHHQGSKEFQLDVRSLSNRKVGPILEEVAKCILLCHNCHAEVRNPTLDLAKLSIEPTALTTELRARNVPEASAS